MIRRVKHRRKRKVYISNRSVIVKALIVWGVVMVALVLKGVLKGVLK